MQIIEKRGCNRGTSNSGGVKAHVLDMGFSRNAFVVTEVFFGTTKRRGNLRRKRIAVFAFEDTTGRVVRPATHDFLGHSVFCSSAGFISFDRYHC